MRPSVGFSAAIAQHEAGHRSEPLRSPPTPSGLMPVAMATASPPLDPPGVTSGFHGLRVAPCKVLMVCHPMPKSGQFVRAIGMAPAARRRPTCGASADGMAWASAGTPCVVAEPARSMFSLTVNGTPCNGPIGAPSATTRSALSAASLA